MSDPRSALLVATAGSQALARSTPNSEDPISSARWQTEPVTGGRFFYDDMLKIPSRVELIVLKRIIDQNELFLPVINPLVPSTIRPPRILQEVTSTTISLNELILFRTANEAMDEDRLLRMRSSSKQIDESWWKIIEPQIPGQYGIALPRGPPESTCRCAIVIQFLSSRPARANVRQAARAELWRLSFENAVTDLAELGAPGGLSYEMSFNKFGMRLSFLGISQTLPSYARRLTRRLVEHHFVLLQGPEYLSSVITSTAVASLQRATNLSLQRRRTIISSLRSSTAYDAATEGIAFLRSCTGVVSFAQGDLLRIEVTNLVQDLQQILEPSLGISKRPDASATPDIDDLLYKPIWKPRSASSCSISGVSLVSDACGRIPR